MNEFFLKLFTRYPVKSKRTLEILPGVFSWALILSPFWASFLAPYLLAYFILFFDVYWLYKSFSLTVTAYLSTKRIREAEKVDWDILSKKFANFNKVSHVAIIPTYTESVQKLRDTINSLKNQTFPAKQIYVVLAMEEREKGAQEKAKELEREFKGVFGDFFATFHPDIEGEVKGKSSNQSYGARVAFQRLVVGGKINLDFATISSVDADSIFHKQYFSYLTYKFLKNSKRHNKFWQSATVYYNNFWRVPAPTRIISFFGSLWRSAVLVQRSRLIPNSTYSLSFRLLERVGFWDTDVIPEDYRIFFKAFFKLEGKVWVEPIFLKTSMDAPLSLGFVRSLKNKYDQEHRWSWGVSDDPLFIKWWATIPNVPFFRKTILVTNVLIDHFLWPVNWFIITVAANIMPFVNPAFTRTAIGYSLPRLSGFILTITLLSLFLMIVIDYRYNPKHSYSTVRKILFPFEFLLLPFAGFFLSTLPAILSHTTLMLGKRIEYKVTEKL